MKVSFEYCYCSHESGSLDDEENITSSSSSVDSDRKDSMYNDIHKAAGDF